MYLDYYGKKWFKGNLHTHTSRLGGYYPPEEVINRYRYEKYDFLAITDHEYASETVEYEDFLLLSGCEYGLLNQMENHGKTYKFVTDINGIGFIAPPELPQEQIRTHQAVIDAIHAKDGLAIFCHPILYHNTPEHVWLANGYDGIEIFNSTSDFKFHNQGYSGDFVDMLAREGLYIPVLAVDDTHYFFGEEFNGFVMVQAENLNRDSIIKSMRERKFFASQGPWVYTRFEDDTLIVECTPATQIRVLTNLLCYSGKEGDRLTSARFILNDKAYYDKVYYYRVEVTDKNGKSAWTHPIPVAIEDDSKK